MSREFTRRRFMAQIVYSSLGGYVLFAAGACKRDGRGKGAPPTVMRSPGRRFFSDAELVTLAAACERILPRDQDPGALDLDVPQFIDRALAGDDYHGWQAPMRQGLAELDTMARSRFTKRFHEAAAQAQDDLLSALQDGTRAQRELFSRLVTLTLEGAFGDPSYGGNRNGDGWRLIGFLPMPGHPLR
jgi:gluconate 2-dehydrogenase gamma chain